MQCIGVDVGKQALVTYDGEKERVFPNRKGLPEFAEFVNHDRDAIRRAFQATLSAGTVEDGLVTTTYHMITVII